MKERVKVKVIVNTPYELPKYETENSAGLDLRANIIDPIVLNPGERCLIPTGLRIELPEGYEAQMRPRSGLALKHGISLVNSPGTIDADYRGDIGAIVINHGTEPFTIKPGERIAQLIISKVEQLEWVPSANLTDTSRGEGGFGHTGTK